jgi:threonine synthase
LRRDRRRRARAEWLWFDFSTLKEPYRIEGKKTMGLELAEPSSAGKLPDAIFYPTGGGTGLIGMWKAFDELEKRSAGFKGRSARGCSRCRHRAAHRLSSAFDEGVAACRALGGCATVAAGIRVPQGRSVIS